MRASANTHARSKATSNQPPPRTQPQRALARSIKDHSHSHAVAKPLTTIAHHTHKALTTIASKASQKPLTTINGQLAVINVQPPREAQKQTRKRKYPHKKPQQTQTSKPEPNANTPTNKESGCSRPKVSNIRLLHFPYRALSNNSLLHAIHDILHVIVRHIRTSRQTEAHLKDVFLHTTYTPEHPHKQAAYASASKPDDTQSSSRA